MGYKNNEEVMGLVEDLELLTQEFQGFAKDNETTAQDLQMALVLLKYALDGTIDEIIAKTGGLK